MNSSKFYENSFDDTEVIESQYASFKLYSQRYIVPFIILFGFVGNTLSFLVFVSSSLRRISTSVYLSALAFSDTGFLFCLGVGWFESFGIPLFHTDGVCQMTVYFSFIFSFTSIWFVAAFTLEMYIVIFHTRNGISLSSPSKAWKVVTLLAVIAALFYMYVFWVAKLIPLGNDKRCTFSSGQKLATVFSFLDTAFTLVVPFSLTLFMMTRLLIYITKFYQSKSIYMPRRVASGGLHMKESVSNNTSRQAVEIHYSLIRMLIVTATVFLVLNLPSHAIRIQAVFRYHVYETLQFSDMEGLMQEIFQVLYYVNFSINFLLYSVCAKSFRSALRRLPSDLNCYKNRTNHQLEQCSLRNNKNVKFHEMKCLRENSRMVDFHISQIPSLDSQCVCKSPPCLLRLESEAEQPLTAKTELH
ncbi:hypothetical protein ACJMK2_015442 [Sinanodonta woodiana]|uniref:G-protein coupled receptors family 1 profile domain-containing protein n=1 Tax=Sinanodonta woodiana TaxID=1069815 RepID=A0ABD3URL2_SINWO